MKQMCNGSTETTHSPTSTFDSEINSPDSHQKGSPHAHYGGTDSDSSGEMRRTQSKDVKRVSRHLREELGLDEFKEEEEKDRKHWFVDHRYFIIAINGAIILNSIQLGSCTKTDARGDGIIRFGEEWEQTCFVFDQVFLWFFVLEAVLRIYFLRCSYFKSPWSWMDLGVLLVGFVDLLMQNGLNLTAFRALRVLRVFRLLRLLRLFKDLWVIVEGLLASFKPTLWIFCLLTLELYIFSIVCVDTIGSAGPDVYPGFTVEEDDILKSQILQSFNNYVYFGTIPRSMYTLFNVVIGAEWPEIGRAVWERQPAIFVMFAFFIICTMFGLMNVLIGIIVDNTKSAQERLASETLAKTLERKAMVVQKLCDFVFNLDKDKDGTVTKQDIVRGMAKKDIKGLMDMLDLPHGFLAEELFHLFNLNGGESITDDEFVTQAYRLIHGNQFHHLCQALSSLNSLKQDMDQVMLGVEDMRRRQEALQEELTSLRREAYARSSSGGSVGVQALRCQVEKRLVRPGSAPPKEPQRAVGGSVGSDAQLRQQLEDLVACSQTLLLQMDSQAQSSISSAASTVADRHEQSRSYQVAPVQAAQLQSTASELLTLPLGLADPCIQGATVVRANTSSQTSAARVPGDTPAMQPDDSPPLLPNMCEDFGARERSGGAVFATNAALRSLRSF